MHKNLCLAFAVIFSNSLSGSYLDNTQAVVVRVPVADCLGKPAEDIDPTVKPEVLYENLAFSPEKGPDSCPRIHQCLYNEVGRVEEERDKEVLVAFPSFYHIVDTVKMSRFWLLKKSLQRLNELKGNLIAYIPEPLQYEKPVTRDERILSIVWPWQDPNTRIWYSVGTRFLRDPQHDDEQNWGVHIIDFSNQTSSVALVSKVCGLTLNSKIPETIESARGLFVGLLRMWLKRKAGEGRSEIAYAWGGCSYFERYPCGVFSLEAAKRGDNDIAHWKRHGKNPGVVSGFDCSGLVLRAAQIAGITYFCKNTTTIGIVLEDVREQEPLEDGDLILIQGHVMIISSVSDDQVLDAASYGTGHGCVREVPLSKAFMSIGTYAELRECAVTKKSLDLQNSKGELLKTVPCVRLLKLIHQRKAEEAKK